MTVPTELVLDPWQSVTDGTHRQAPQSLRLFAALVVGAAAECARLAVDGFHWRAVALVLLAVGWLALVEMRPCGPAGLALLAVGAVSAPLLTGHTIGRAPVLLMLVAVFVAHAALVRWQPIVDWPERSVTVAGLAVFPLVGAGILWFREEIPILTGALLVLALLVVEAYHRFPSTAWRIDRAVAGVLVGSVSAIGAAMLFMVVLVFLYLPGLLGAGADRIHRQASRSSFWFDRSVAQHEPVRDVDRPFSSAPPAARRSRNLIGGALILALIAATGVFVIDRRSAQQEVSGLEIRDVFERAASVRFSDLAAYEGKVWADELKAEQDVLSNEYLRSSEVAGYDVADFSGEYTNVIDGVRRTIDPPPCPDCRSATLWIAGGSAAFGLGQRDPHTIASELVRLAAADGISAEITNLGVPGYTIHQEAQKVLDRLDSGAPVPDTVLFFDGYNDVVARVMDSTVKGIRPDTPTLMETEVIRTFTDEGLDPFSAGTPEQLGALAAEKYRREAGVVAAELAGHGIESVFVFQPDAFASPEQYAAVSAIYELDPNVKQHMEESLEAASTILEDRVVNLRHLLDDGPLVFADLVHTNEVAARTIAEAVHSVLHH